MATTEVNNSPADAPARPEIPTAAEIAAPLAAPRVRQMMGRYRGPAPDDIDNITKLCQLLASGTAALPYAHRGKEGDIAGYVMRAIDLDIGVSTALDNLHFDKEGRCGMRARLMHALVIRAGHQVRITHADETQVRMRLIRGDGQPGGSAAWRMAEAIAAGLVGADKKNAWRSYASDMLWARCISRLTRRYAPDVTAGMHEVSELIDGITDDDAAIESVDLSTAMVDADGNLVPSPDVVELLEDLDVADFDQVTDKWRRAKEAGLLGAYAGTVDGVDHLVEELLYVRGIAVKPAADADADGTAPAAAPTPAAETNPVAAAADAGGSVLEGVPVPVADLAAGDGDRVPCGCRPAALMARGRHETGCGITGNGAGR